MVQPVLLTLGAVVAALLTKAAEKGGENLADAAKASLGRLLGWLRQRFSRDGDTAGSTALAHAEEVPHSPSRVAALASATDRRATADPGFGSELGHLVQNAKKAGGPVESIVQTAWGNQNVARCPCQVLDDHRVLRSDPTPGRCPLKWAESSEGRRGGGAVGAGGIRTYRSPAWAWAHRSPSRSTSQTRRVPANARTRSPRQHARILPPSDSGL